jgi:hypothetical protein
LRLQFRYFLQANEYRSACPTMPVETSHTSCGVDSGAERLTNDPKDGSGPCGCPSINGLAKFFNRLHHGLMAKYIDAGSLSPKGGYSPKAQCVVYQAGAGCAPVMIAPPDVANQGLN